MKHVREQQAALNSLIMPIVTEPADDLLRQQAELQAEAGAVDCGLDQLEHS